MKVDNDDVSKPLCDTSIHIEKVTDKDGIKIELILSRSAYRRGDTLVGTIRLILDEEDEDVITVPMSILDIENDERKKKNQKRIRNAFHYASVHVHGKCHIDPRWHPDFEHIKELHDNDTGGRGNPLLDDLPIETLSEIFDSHTKNGAGARNPIFCVCSFGTNCVNLLNLKERIEPRMRDPGVKLTRFSTKANCSSFLRNDVNGSDHDVCDGNSGPDKLNSNTAQYSEEIDYVYNRPFNHLAFTFRVKLPYNLPHTIQARCCRYSYAAVVSVRIRSGRVITVQVPFTLLSCVRMSMHSNSVHSSSDIRGYESGGTSQSSERVKFGQCIATAHSDGFPCYVSPPTLDRLSQIGVSSTGLCSSMSAKDFRSFRVTNSHGLPICIISLVGLQVMMPGGRALLEFNFERNRVLQNEGHGDSLLRCYQICACLGGEEVAHHHNILSDSSTQTYIFDAKHTLVENSTDSLSMNLMLPIDAPCTLSTYLVDIRTTCKIELTVEKYVSTNAGKTKSNECEYEVLRLELPCDVVHTKVYENHESDPGNSSTDAFNSTKAGDSGCQDELNDLTMLSIEMMDRTQGTSE